MEQGQPGARARRAAPAQQPLCHVHPRHCVRAADRHPGRRGRDADAEHRHQQVCFCVMCVCMLGRCVWVARVVREHGAWAVFVLVVQKEGGISEFLEAERVGGVGGWVSVCPPPSTHPSINEKVGEGGRRAQRPAHHRETSSRSGRAARRALPIPLGQCVLASQEQNHTPRAGGSSLASRRAGFGPLSPWSTSPGGCWWRTITTGYGGPRGPLSSWQSLRLW